MRLIDLDQTIFVPIIDESQGGVKYEMQMTVAEMFDKFCEGVQPETIAAIPVEWMEDKELDYRTIGDKMFSDAFAVVIGEWQKEQEAR